MSDRRNAVFLEEMGVGPQWRLRNHPAGEPVPEEVAPVAADPVYAEVASQPVAVAPQAPVSVAPRAAAPQPPPVAVEAAPAAPVPSVPAAPARPPGTPSIASTGEDMSWFDDAPTPEFKPQRKKVAAEPEPATAAQPQRPARPMPPAAPATSSAAPAYDDLPMEEPPSWFDDDQPAAVPQGARAPAHGQASDTDIAAMDWPAMQAAISTCTRCPRCATRQQAVPGRGDEQAAWLALDTAPSQVEDAEGYQFAGDPGYLLDNMLKAVGQSTEKGAYLTSLVKCHAPHAPAAEELQACRPYLERELALTGAKVIVAFGHGAGKGLLGSAARGRIMLHGSVPVVATYHPADLLKKPEEKAKAWQDLCLAKAAHAGRR